MRAKRQRGSSTATSRWASPLIKERTPPVSNGVGGVGGYRQKWPWRTTMYFIDQAILKTRSIVHSF
jgi:hypothetical protein